MSRGRILALYAAPSWTGRDALEFLRVVAALVACGHDVLLREVEVVLRGEELPDEAERILEELAALGVSPRRLAARDLETAPSILRLGAPDRRSEPSLLISNEAAVDTLLEAGQVIRNPA